MQHFLLNLIFAQKTLQKFCAIHQHASHVFFCFFYTNNFSQGTLTSLALLTTDH